ncbi:unnamed protein product, partial [Pleuronectes platessa]
MRDSGQQEPQQEQEEEAGGGRSIKSNVRRPELQLTYSTKTIYTSTKSHRCSAARQGRFSNYPLPPPKSTSTPPRDPDSAHTSASDLNSADMEGHTGRLALLLCITAAFSASSQTCDPKEVAGNPWFHMREMLTGCWTSFVTENKTEVHILNFGAMHSTMFSLNMEDAKPMDLILTSAVTLYGLYNINAGVRIHLSNNSSMFLHANHLTGTTAVHKHDMPTQDDELVKWASKKFGGVTSFTTVRNLISIKSTGTTGTKPGSRDCVLKNEDASEKHFLEIQIEDAPLASSLTSCSPPQQPKNQVDGAELHIINIPENTSISNVLLRVDEKKIRVFLRGPQGTTWMVLNAQYTQFGSNNDILLPNIRIPPSHTLNSDNARDVQRKALKVFNVSTFTSYTELRPANSTILLVLVNNDAPA